MNSSLSPEILIVKNTDVTTTKSIHSDTILENGVSAFIDVENVKAQGAGHFFKPASHIADVAPAGFMIVQGTGSKSKGNKLSTIIKKSNVVSATKTEYEAPRKQMTILNGSIGDAIVKNTTGGLEANSFYIALKDSNGFKTVTAVLSNIWSISGTTTNIPEATATEVKKGSIYKCTTGGNTANDNASDKVLAEIQGVELLSALTEGNEVGVLIIDNSRLYKDGKNDPGDKRFYSAYKTANNSADNMLANIVDNINSGNPVAEAFLIPGTQIIVLKSREEGDNFVAKANGEYYEAATKDFITASRGINTLEQVREMITLASYNKGNMGSYELKDKYHPALEDDFSLLSSMGSEFAVYHIRHTTPRINSYGKIEAGTAKDLFVVTIANSQSETELDAIIAAI